MKKRRGENLGYRTKSFRPKQGVKSKAFIAIDVDSQTINIIAQKP